MPRPVQPAQVVRQELLALGGGERDVGVEQERGEVVLCEAGAQALEVDEADFAGAHDDVLALEIAVDETARLAAQMLGDFQQPRAITLLCEPRDMHAEVPAQAVLEEIILLPAVERGVEDGLQVAQRIGVGRAMRLGVEDERLVERALVERAARGPRCLALAPQIRLARILHEDEALGFIVEMDARHAHTDAGEEARDGDVVFVLRPVLAVADEDERLRADVHPPEFAARAALFDGSDGDGVVQGGRHLAASVGSGARRVETRLRDITRPPSPPTEESASGPRPPRE